MKHSLVWLVAPSLVVVGFWVHPSFAPAGPPDAGLTPDEERLKKAMLQYSDAVTALLEAQIEVSKHRRARGMISAQIYGRYVKWLQDELERFRKQPHQVPHLYLWKIKVGDIGCLTGGLSSTTDPEENRFRVFQVIDGNNMLIQSDDIGMTENEANVPVKRVQKIAWVSGIDTGGITDNSYVKLGQIFEVRGTKQYVTALGSTKTVFMISPFAIQDTNELTNKLAAIEVPATHENTPAKPKWKTELRTWTDATGKFSVRAKYGGIIASEVVLVTEDGRKIQVPIQRLSDADKKLLE